MGVVTVAVGRVAADWVAAEMPRHVAPVRRSSEATTTPARVARCQKFKRVFISISLTWKTQIR
jgi:hypothetical protein